MLKSLFFALIFSGCVLALAQPVGAAAETVNAFWKVIPMSSGSISDNRQTLLSQLQSFNLAPRWCVNLAESDGYNDGVYYLGDDGRRHPFADARVYASWYAEKVQTHVIPAEQLARIPLGGTITYKPGTRLIKFEVDPKVYDMDANGWLRWIKTPASAIRMYGENWQQRIDVVSDAFFINYIFGQDID